MNAFPLWRASTRRVSLWLLAFCLALVANVGMAAEAAEAVVTPYRLTPGDTIAIKLYFNPELNDQVQIRPDGRITLQLIGEVNVGGRTVMEAMELIERLYESELKTPRATLQVLGFAAQKVWVTGEVTKPGVVALAGNLNLFGAIGEAGGIKYTGTRDAVVLIRKSPDGTPSLRKVQLLTEDGQPTQDALGALQPFDVVLVPETQIAELNRWVDQYIRQLSPANLAVGFSYLYTKGAWGFSP
jgi:protein involved in polysaccharide export with SLBB domain